MTLKKGMSRDELSSIAEVSPTTISSNIQVEKIYHHSTTEDCRSRWY
jgi:hypothetical protein